MDTLRKAGIWTLARLREPSTYAGLSALLVLAHVPHATDFGPAIVQLGAGIMAIVAIVRPEGK